MAIARAHLVNPSVTRCYHCITRCVRRTFLLGEGPGDRKEWVEWRLKGFSLGSYLLLIPAPSGDSSRPWRAQQPEIAGVTARIREIVPPPASWDGWAEPLVVETRLNGHRKPLVKCRPFTMPSSHCLSSLVLETPIAPTPAQA